jgi:putative addiction module killer protein
VAVVCKLLVDLFKRQGNTIIVLLCGGDKGTQKRDIELAKQLAQEGGAQYD